MLTQVYSGFKDQESYEQFEIAYNAFIEKCRTGECPSSAAHACSRSSFRLGVTSLSLGDMPIFHKSFHCRTVIDLAFRLAPHKPPRTLVVENVIWDAIFRLAEGRIFVYSATRPSKFPALV
jgi:hypothetical protein